MVFSVTTLKWSGYAAVTNNPKPEGSKQQFYLLLTVDVCHVLVKISVHRSLRE